MGFDFDKKGGDKKFDSSIHPSQSQQHVLSLLPTSTTSKHVITNLPKRQQCYNIVDVFPASQAFVCQVCNRLSGIECLPNHHKN